MKFVSTCGAGLEGLVAGEVKSYGGQISSSRRGEIRWSAPLEAGYRACLWSRFSSRVVLVLTEFDIQGSDDLYEAAHSTTWEDHLSVRDNFAVDCVLADGGPLTNSMYGALRIKDGVVDRFRERTGIRPAVKVQRPAVRVYLQVHGKQALLGLDLSGEGLHRRGYRVASGPAPLKENLAAAIIALSGWEGDVPLLDPMCGSATLLIEAALIRADSAPGLSRSYYGLTGWRGHQDNIWNSMVAEALEREADTRQQKWPPLIGYDGDRSAIGAARKNIARAGFADRIHVEQQEIHRLDDKLGQSGFLVCNPPYGERLSDSQAVKHLYRFMGECFQRQFPAWRITLFTAAPDYADQFKVAFEASVKIFNGPLACRLFSGLPLPVSDRNWLQGWHLSLAKDGDTGTELSNRLKKNFRKFHSWAVARKLHWYRLYDRDLPQYNVTIDVVGGHLCISEFPAPRGKDPRVADERFSEVTRTVRNLFDASRDQVVVNRIRAAKKSSRKGGVRQKLFEIREGDAVFLAGGGTGLERRFFPEQRFVRKFIGHTVGRGPFLSLFDSSGGATISAVLGGAKETATIGVTSRDEEMLLSSFSRNGLHPDNHDIAFEDVGDWLNKNRQQFSLIYIYFRHKRYRLNKSTVFDVVSGHPLLINRAVAALADGGRVLVSSLIAGFELDPAVIKSHACNDLSRKLSSPDIVRGGRNFRCWELTKREVDESGAS
jgi:23S rRNA (guanine2445-N2)-methyltransferase / 23S rRNA (guanine2069-N7)-methyltransferase